MAAEIAAETLVPMCCTPDDAPPEAFTPREWIALFPAPAVRAQGSLEPPPADPAKLLRAESPLSRRDLLAAVGASPALALLVRAQLSLAPYVVPYHGWRVTAYYVTGLALLSVQWAFVGDLGRFSTAQLAVGTFVTALHTTFAFVIFAFFAGVFTRRIVLPSDLSEHPFAVFVRWSQLCDEEPGSRLLRHDPADALCPCPAAGCAGKLLDRAALLRVVEVASHICVGFQLYFFIYLVMPAVAYAAYSWTSPWAATLCVANALLIAETVILQVLAGARHNVATMQLTLRLHKRACRLALDGLLSRYRALAAGSQSGPHPVLVDEPYLALQDSLGPTWRTRLQRVASGPVFILTLPLYALIVAAAGIALGNCIPFAAVGALIMVAFLAALDLTVFTASNSHVAAVAELFDEARSALRRARYEADAAGPAPSVAARELGEHHDRLLSAFSRAPEAFFARFMGFRVDAAVSRNVAATAMTLAIGLWSILRSSGVRLTLYTTCG